MQTAAPNPRMLRLQHIRRYVDDMLPTHSHRSRACIDVPFIYPCNLQLAQSIGENARLRAEIRDLRSQLRLTAVNDETAVNLDDMTMLTNSASTVDDFLQGVKKAEGCKRPKGVPEWYGMAHKRWYKGGWYKNKGGWYKNAWLLNKDCSLTPEGKICLKNFIEYNGTSGHPKWNVSPPLARLPVGAHARARTHAHMHAQILGGSPRDYPMVTCTNTSISSNASKPGGGGSVKIEATVSCPCNNGGNALSVDDARTRILGQITAMT